MSSVFRKGDVVFHNLHGKLTVTEPNHWNGDVYLSTEDNRLITCDTRSLSFTPWPAPCHVRPFTEVGWWIGYNEESGDYQVRWRLSVDTHQIKPNCGEYKQRIFNTKERTRWIKFLGKEIE